MGVNFTMMLKSVFSLIRTGNLLIVALVFLLIRYCIILPILGLEETTSSTGNQEFALLLLSTLMITAGGYVINDIFDTRVDAVNKPGKNKVGSVISNFNAKVLYAFLTLSGLAGSFLFGTFTGVRYAVLIFFLCAGLLYFYSSSYKTMLLSGNMVISFLSGMSVMITIIFDHQAMRSEPILTLVLAYSVFAFLMTMIREIIKDCEDIDGDSRYGASTLPVVAGITIARRIAGSLSLLVFAAVITVQILQMQWESPIPFLYVTTAIQAPLIMLTWKCFKAKSKRDDRFNSGLSKVIMVTGILSMAVFYLSF
jgi:4-hydroxybenzoate polyprenyltransferase